MKFNWAEKTSVEKTKFITYSIAIVLTLTLCLQNFQKVHLDILFWDFSVSLILLSLTVFLISGGTVYYFLSQKSKVLKKQNNELLSKIDSLTKELEANVNK